MKDATIIDRLEKRRRGQTGSIAILLSLAAILILGAMLGTAKMTNRSLHHANYESQQNSSAQQTIESAIELVELLLNNGSVFNTVPPPAMNWTNAPWTTGQYYDAVGDSPVTLTLTGTASIRWSGPTLGPDGWFIKVESCNPVFFDKKEIDDLYRLGQLPSIDQCTPERAPPFAPSIGHIETDVYLQHFVAGDPNHLDVMAMTSVPITESGKTFAYKNRARLFVPDAWTVSTTVAPPAAPPGSCDTWVHEKTGSPEWYAVFQPAIPMRNGAKDDIVIPHMHAPQMVSHGLLHGSLGNIPAAYPNSTCKRYFTSYSPLIVDMTGKGPRFSPPEEGPRFDMTGNGIRHRYSWPREPELALFLVKPRDPRRGVRDVNDLFGENTLGPDGKTAANGFEALRKYDDNHDGVIDPRDKVYSELRLWADRNRDGKSSPDEVYTLAQKGIRSIRLSYVDRGAGADAAGNELKYVARAVLVNRQALPVYDVWLAHGSDDAPPPSKPASRRLTRR